MLGSILLSSCEVQGDTTYQVLTPTEYEQIINKKEVQIVDVRTAGEYSQGHIKDALNIDVNASDFKKKIDQLDKNKPIYIYCRSGARSYKAGKIMSTLGFEEIYDLRGGISSWRGEIRK